MKVTATLKGELVKGHGLAATASDDDVRRMTGEKLATGAITVEQYAAWTKADDGPANKIKGLIDSAIDAKVAPITSALGELTAFLKTGKFGTDGASLTPASPTADGTPPGSPTGIKAVTDESLGLPNASKAFGGSGREALIGGVGSGEISNPGGAARVKSPLEGYSSSKTAATYDTSKNPVWRKHFAGRQLKLADDTGSHRSLDMPSQKDMAVAGAFFKYAVNSAAQAAGHAGAGIGAKFRLTEHDKQIVDHALHELPWNGVIGWNEGSDQRKATVHNRKLADWERKALLDDVLSGGLDAAPIAFDDAVIIFPLLNGELFPLVNLVNVTRGRRIEAFSIGNPTFTWGVYEGTNIPLFDTDSFIAAFDNNIYNAVGALPIGIDFEEDAPNNIGDIVTQRYGEAALTTLDTVIAVGDGITQPQGVFNASGTASVSAANTTSGPPSLADYSGLLFGLAKQYRQPRAAFLTNDVSYARSRNLKVDPASPSTDERRLLGMNFEEYRTLGHDHKINNSIPNGTQGFFDFGRYRMYRRLGLQIRIETQGQTLALLNERLIVCRMRMGGALEVGAAGAVITNGQS